MRLGYAYTKNDLSRIQETVLYSTRKNISRQNNRRGMMGSGWVGCWRWRMSVDGNMPSSCLLLINALIFVGCDEPKNMLKLFHFHP